MRGDIRLGRVLSIALPVGLAILLVTLWWVSAALAQSAVLPTPATALDRLTANLQGQRFRQSIGDTLYRLAIAYVGVVVIGAALGFAVGLSKFWSDALSPVLYAIYSVPKIVLFPLFLVFLGLTDASQIAFAFFSGVLPMVIMVINATAGVPRLPLKLAASVNMPTWAVVRKIVFPSVLPALASALRLTFGLTFLGLLIGEMFAGVSGLGYELLRNIPLGRLGDITGEVALILVIALVPVTALSILEKRIKNRYSPVEG
ncbi:ABC transporter [Rhodococcus sp. 06-418-5]|jgi:NitT/TauT family transport system permease protein|nr:ABC transporter [Rhodococcus sp. 06-418-5]